MRDRYGRKAIGGLVVSLAVVAAGCDSASSPVAPSEVPPPPGLIEMTPAGAIVGTSVVLQSNIAKTPWHYGADPGGSNLSYTWDFGDGSTATGGDSMSHVYVTEGTFFATVTASSGDAGSQRATSNIQVGSLTGRWSGDYGHVSITQDGLELRGRYLDDPREGSVEGRVGMTGRVTFTITRPGLDPVTFSGTAGANVMTLVGTATGRDAVERPMKLTRG
jgi:hypothetical protein